MIIFHLTENPNLKNISPQKDCEFIHCCTFPQILKIADVYFKKSQKAVFAVCINTNYLNPEIKWKESKKDKSLFPHVFGSINESCIICCEKLEKDENGNFLMPENLKNFSAYEKSCGGIITRNFNNEKKYLIIKFSHNGKSIWGFPKGHANPDETEIETAKREIFEEVGLSVEILPNLRASAYFSCVKGTTIEAVYYAAHSDSGSVKCQKSEVSDFLWCSADEVINKLSFECDKTIFKKLK